MTRTNNDDLSSSEVSDSHGNTNRFDEDDEDEDDDEETSDRGDKNNARAVESAAPPNSLHKAVSRVEPVLHKAASRTVTTATATATATAAAKPLNSAKTPTAPKTSAIKPSAAAAAAKPATKPRPRPRAKKTPAGVAAGSGVTKPSTKPAVSRSDASRAVGAGLELATIPGDDLGVRTLCIKKCTSALETPANGTVYPPLRILTELYIRRMLYNISEVTASRQEDHMVTMTTVRRVLGPDGGSLMMLTLDDLGYLEARLTAYTNDLEAAEASRRAEVASRKASVAKAK